jgi:cytochrome oxidase assembly protein ShyY1
LNEASRGGPGVVATTFITLVCLIILVGLGVWQLQRKVWKENLIAAMTTRLNETPQPLPPPGQWGALRPDADEFRRIGFSATFVPGEEALVYTPGSALRTDIKGPGYFVFAPARLADGRTVVVDRGFVPLDRKDSIDSIDSKDSKDGEPVNVVGVLRWPESRGMFTPPDDLKGNVWYLREPAAMAAARHWGEVAPFYVDQESPVPPGGLPSPGKLVVNLPDNHLQYAITWFGLAAGLVGVYGYWLFGRFRKPD